MEPAAPPTPISSPLEALRHALAHLESHPELFNFNQATVPRSLSSQRPACILAWAAAHMGEQDIAVAARRVMGTPEDRMSEHHFYDLIDRAWKRAAGSNKRPWTEDITTLGALIRQVMPILESAAIRLAA